MINYLYIKRIAYLLIGFLSLSAPASKASVDPYLVAHFPMELKGNSITEMVSGSSFTVSNNFNRPENIPGAEGNALRLDGYSTFCNARINSSALNASALSFSVWCALETNPVMDPNIEVSTETYIAGNMNENLKTGFAFTLNGVGAFSFQVYIDGMKVTCADYNQTLNAYVWHQLVATVNNTTKEVNLYKNGELISSSYFFGKGIINTGTNEFTIGKSFTDTYTGVFRTNTINGLIDDIRIYSKSLTGAELTKKIPDHAADLSIPATRHEDDIHRPEYHGLPATNWTNEPHGLVHFNNKYHLFFQKNANGPYWGKLHWGHLSSDDLLNWKEEKIALFNTSGYDIKGVWSGCVFTDEELTDGKPNIFYTGADFVKTSINQAVPNDENLITWTKNSKNPIIPHRPVGLSDDFRDPYIFKSNGSYYMIVGTSKDGVGATTLHRYDSQSKTWSNDGSIFYQSSSIDYGFFWEMPAIVPMSDGKWLFLVTTLGGKQGVENLYWVGNINSDGKFNPFSDTPKEVELSTFGTNGYGFLSPSIMQKDGKTIAIGIVPDKLLATDNLNLGWAHLYSLPRELSLDTNNNLVQQPYSGIRNIRTSETAYSLVNQDISTTHALSPVSGKTLEIDGNFIVGGASKFGYNVRKSGGNYISVYFTPSTNKITVDARNCTRLINDAGSYNGLYESVLPQTMNSGDNLSLHVFMDHSIMDIFVNNTFAFSIRIFPTETNAVEAEVFSEGGTTRVSNLNAWKLDPSTGHTGISLPKLNNDTRVYTHKKEIIYEKVPVDTLIHVYNTTGELVYTERAISTSGNIHLPDNQAYIVKIFGSNPLISKVMI